MHLLRLILLTLLSFCVSVAARGQSPDGLRLLPSVNASLDGPVLDPPDATAGQVPVDAPDETRWFDSGSWDLAKVWEGSFEAGINGSDGNTQTLSLRAGGDLIRKLESAEWSLDISYARANSDSRQTQHNALFGSKYEWLMSLPRLTWFIKFGMEYDEFKAFDVLLVSNTGLGYQLIDTETTTLTGTFGGGLSRAIGEQDQETVPEAVFGLELKRQLTEGQKLVAEVEYLPEFNAFEDCRLNTDVGWEILLDEAADLHLKLSIIDRYDSEPQGAKHNGLDYSLLLLWKL